jgi:hypothetical protein
MDASKSFKIGERVTFDTQDFADICWTLVLLGMDVTEKMNSFAASKGVLRVTEVPSLKGEDAGIEETADKAQP